MAALFFQTSEVLWLNRSGNAWLKSLDILVNLCLIAHKVVIKSLKLHTLSKNIGVWVLLAKEIVRGGDRL
jgi:hypothetical protein